MSPRSRHSTLAPNPSPRLPITWVAVFVVVLICLFVGAWVVTPELGLYFLDPMLSP